MYITWSAKLRTIASSTLSVMCVCTHLCMPMAGSVCAGLWQASASVLLVRLRPPSHDLRDRGTRFWESGSGRRGNGLRMG
jgi:hypothetical protein